LLVYHICFQDGKLCLLVANDKLDVSNFWCYRPVSKVYSKLLGISILSIKNGNDNVRIEDNCLEEELATTPILSEIRTLSLTFVMLMRFFARLNIYYKTFLTRMQCDTTPFTSCCHNVDFCIAFLRQSANNYRHCSFCAQISPVVLKNKQ
jgi:hypothetical protein